MGKGSEARPFYEKTPMLNFRLHLFNVTNKDEVIQGGRVVCCIFLLFNWIDLITYLSIYSGKPKLQEIGPYFFEWVWHLHFMNVHFYISFNSSWFNFREWKEKYNLVDNEENDTLTYRFKNTYIFRPDLSGPGLTGDEIVVIPHPSKSANSLNDHRDVSFNLTNTKI